MQRTNREIPGNRAGRPASITPPERGDAAAHGRASWRPSGHRAAAVRRCQRRGGVDWPQRGRPWSCPGRTIESSRPNIGH